MIAGRVHKYGADVDTDGIIPARYANLSEPASLGRHCLENLDPGFAARVAPGDLLMATTNFGCGSSREQAPWAIKGAGVSCVIAVSFARIFFRNAINIGLPLLECPEAVAGTRDGDRLEVDLTAGRIRNATRDDTFQAAPFPEFIREIVACGGLVEFTRKRLRRPF